MDARAEQHLMNSRSVTVTFDRRDTVNAVDSVGTYFPDDPLLAELDAFEKKYLDYCNDVPLESTGDRPVRDDGWHAFLEFLHRWVRAKSETRRSLTVLR